MGFSEYQLVFDLVQYLLEDLWWLRSRLLFEHLLEAIDAVRTYFHSCDANTAAGRDSDENRPPRISNSTVCIALLIEERDTVPLVRFDRPAVRHRRLSMLQITYATVLVG